MKKVATVTLMVVVCTVLICGQKTCCQERKDHLAFTSSFHSVKIDTISDPSKSSKNQIHINGRSNSIIIENNSCDQNESNVENTVEVNGTNNSITITQSTPSAKTSIQQNGNSNQVNIKQTKPEN